MEMLLTLCGLLLTATLALGGAAKWGATAATRDTMRELGLPRPAAQWLAPALPAVELALATMLLLPAVAWSAAVLAMLLYAGMSAVVCGNLLAGRAPPCNCFGQHRGAPITWATALANSVLLACAGVLVWHAPIVLVDGLALWTLGAAQQVDSAAIAWLLVTLLVALVVWLLCQLVRQQGRLLLRIDALDERMNLGGIAPLALALPATLHKGELAPEFDAMSLAGRPVSSAQLFQEGRDLLLLFVSPGCAPCRELLAELPSPWQRADRLVVITDEAADGAADVGHWGGLEVLVQREQAVSRRFGAIATPSAVRVRRDGIIATPLAVGRDAILALLGNALQAHELRRPEVSALP